MKTFAVVENKIVTNVIIADDNFAELYTKSPDHIGECFEYDEINEDDTKIARIGEIYIDGKFISGNQAVELGLMSKEDILAMGVAYIEPITEELK